MKLLRLALVSGAAAVALGLAACGETADETGANGEDSAMTASTDETGSTPTGDGAATPAEAARTRAAAGDVDSLPEGDECGASKVATFVSQEATPAVRARIAAEVGHSRIRWIGPDTVVTMDFRPDRLNVTLDENDIITGARCS